MLWLYLRIIICHFGAILVLFMLLFQEISRFTIGAAAKQISLNQVFSVLRLDLRRMLFVIGLVFCSIK